jgi:hypothetical protein
LVVKAEVQSQVTTLLKVKPQPMQSLLWGVFPIFRWLPEYQSQWWKADFFAGLTLWGLLVLAKPQKYNAFLRPGVDHSLNSSKHTKKKSGITGNMQV